MDDETFPEIKDHDYIEDWGRGDRRREPRTSNMCGDNLYDKLKIADRTLCRITTTAGDTSLKRNDIDEDQKKMQTNAKHNRKGHHTMGNR